MWLEKDRQHSYVEQILLDLKRSCFVILLSPYSAVLLFLESLVTPSRLMFKRVAREHNLRAKNADSQPRKGFTSLTAIIPH